MGMVCIYRCWKRVKCCKYNSYTSFWEGLSGTYCWRQEKVPWWNGELQNLRRQANIAFHYAYKTRSIEHWKEYKKIRRSFKRVLRRSKRESWQSFCTKLEQTHESSRIYKILRKAPWDDKLGMLQLPDGSWTKKSEQEAYQHLLLTHFSGCVFTPETVCTLGGNTHTWIPSINWPVASETGKSTKR